MRASELHARFLKVDDLDSYLLLRVGVEPTTERAQRAPSQKQASHEIARTQLARIF